METMQNNTATAMQFFINKGWQPHQAAGIVGNLMAESGLNPKVKPGDHGTAFGIAQWRHGRLDGLKRFAQAQGKDWRDFETQLGFVHHELNSSERNAGNRIRTARNVQEANDGMILYERPFGSNKGARHAHNYSGRLKFSNQALGWVGRSPQSPQFNQPQVGQPLNPITSSPDQIISAKTPLTFDERLERARNEIKPYDNFLDETGAALHQTLTSNIIRHASRGAVDPFWIPNEDELTKLYASTPDNYHPMLDNARSQADLDEIVKHIGEDIQRSQRLVEGGWRGVGSQFTAGILDPVGWLAGLGGGKVAQIGNTTYRITAATGLGAASNAALDYGSGALFDDPHTNPIMAAVFGAGFGTLGGIMMKNPATKHLAQDVNKLAVATQKPNTTPVPSATLGEVIEPTYVNGNLSSASNNLQAKSENLFDKQLYNLLDDVADTDVAKGFAGKVRFDVAGQMSTSENMVTRMLGQYLVPDGVGMRSIDDIKPITPHSVTDVFQTDLRINMAHYDRTYYPALNNWKKEQGISKWRPFEQAEAEKIFSHSVADYIDNPHLRGEFSPHIASAGDAQIKAYQMRAEEMRAAGLGDFDANTSYRPLVPNVNKVAEFDMQFEPSVIHKALEKSILARLPDLDPTMAKTMAEGYYRNIRRGVYGVDLDIEYSLSMGDREGFLKAALDAFGQVHHTTVKDLEDLYEKLIKKTSGEEADIGTMRHAQRRTLLDYNLVSHITDGQGNIIPFKVLDFFEKDADLTFRRYMHKTQGMLAFANTPLKHPITGKTLMNGVKSEADFDKLKNMLKESYRDRGQPVHEWQSDLKNQLNNMDFIRKKLLAIPFNYNQTKAAEQARRLRAMEYIRLMANMGFNQLQEFTRTFSQVGFMATARQIPASLSLIKAMVTGDPKVRAQIVHEVQSIYGVGTTHLTHNNSLRLDIDRLGAPMGNKFTQKVDKFLDAGQRITANLTLFRHTHSYQQSLTTQAINQSIADMARRLRRGDGSYNFNKAKGREVERMATMGLDKGDLAKLFDNILQHGEFKNKTLITAGEAHWQPDVLSKHRLFMTRYTDNVILNNDIGSMSKWMSHPVALMLLQFRAFVIGAWTKSTLYGINHWDMGQFILVMGELVAGMATYAAQRLPSLLNEESRQKYLGDLSDPLKWSAKGWSRAASASILPSVLDFGLGFLPTDFRFDARASGQATDGILGNPLVGHIGQAGSAIKGWGKAALGQQAPTQSTVRQTVQSFLPFSNWIGFTAILNSLIDPLPTKYKTNTKKKSEKISPTGYKYSFN